MSANPEQVPPNKKRDLITRFKDEYSAAFADVEVAADTTRTEGWARLYAHHRKSQREECRRIAAELRMVADRVEVLIPSEDEEKEIGELKKSCTTLREQNEAFEHQVIEPVREPVQRCEKIIYEAQLAAQTEEERFPLVNTGLEHLMRMEIENVPRAKWDHEHGRVIINRK